jgi:hypothetical protein
VPFVIDEHLARKKIGPKKNAGQQGHGEDGYKTPILFLPEDSLHSCEAR